MTQTGYLKIAAALATVLVVSVLSLLVSAGPARAATTFTVNSTGDAPDTGTADNACDTDTATAGEQCTLRAAIQQANGSADPNQQIEFNIPASDPGYDAATGVWKISPAFALPTITEWVSINGYTQPGSSPNTLAAGSDAVLRIELNGSSVGAADGLSTSSGGVVSGLAINNFTEGAGIHISGAAESFLVSGNYIGTDTSGTVPKGNLYGVLVDGSRNDIGGTLPRDRNLISGNMFSGVHISDGGALSRQGKVMGNIVASNGGDGITVVGDAKKHSIYNNSVYANGGLGIDLGDDGRTLNDTGDPDTGPNDLQNYPVLSSARTEASKTKVKGKLDSTPNETFLLQFFKNPRSTRDEGKKYIGEKTVTDTDGDGIIPFTFKPKRKVRAGMFVTATATSDSTGDTSEFSDPRKVKRVR